MYTFPAPTCSVEVSFGAPTTRNEPPTARDSPNCPAVVSKLGEPSPVLVRKIDGDCSGWVEVTDVVCGETVVTDAEVEEEVVIEEVEVLEAKEEVDEVGAELVVVVVWLVAVVEVAGVVEVVVLLLVPIVIVPIELLELLEEVNIPLTPIMSAAARTITTIITAMIILPIAGLSSTPDRSFNCNLAVPET
jgi:hypothetical protein